MSMKLIWRRAVPEGVTMTFNPRYFSVLSLALALLLGCSSVRDQQSQVNATEHPQVVIEVRPVEIPPEGIESLGIEWIAVDQSEKTE